MAVVRTTQDGIAVISLNNPVANAFDFPCRWGIFKEIENAQLDATVTAIVMIGAGDVFSEGVGVNEINTLDATREPSLHTVIRSVECSEKPVVAAIHNAATGAGLELALGAHYRIASRGARIALPEVRLGLLPWNGGTQRLPRAIGLESALSLIVSGEQVMSESLAGAGLFDLICEGALLDEAVKFAQKVVSQGGPYPKLRDRTIDHPNAEGFIQFARNTVAPMAKNFPAPLKCIDAVAAGIEKGFDKGLAVESAGFLALVQTPESRALRHAFFSERAASNIPDVPADTPVRNIERIGVIGAGTMGGGIAMNFINVGLPVTLLETRQDALDRGMAAIRKNYESAVKKGRLTAEKLEARMGLITPTLSYDDLGQADLIIEAVFEDLDVKEQVFSRLDRVAKKGAILASNTSTLNVDTIAAFTKRPNDVIGMHFFSPANVMKLLEVVRGAKTSKDVLATVMQLAEKIKKTAVVSGVCDGFIGNRMLEQYIRQALFMLEEGALPWQVDQAIEKFGFSMGPFRMSDLAGNDILWAIRKRRYAEEPDLNYSRIADELCDSGRFGQKTGAGWYDYEAGNRIAHPSNNVDEMVVAYSKEQGIARRTISDEEIVERLVFALVNEGALILEEGIASKASDIDIVYLTGYGFPRHRGGPMHYADTVGLFNVVRMMRKYASQSNGDAWKPAAHLKKLAEEARSFSS